MGLDWVKTWEYKKYYALPELTRNLVQQDMEA